MHSLYFIGMITESVQEIKSHYHPCWEFVYYLEGQGTITVGETGITFEPGVFICLPPNIPHSEFSEHGFRNIHFCVEEFVWKQEGIPLFRDNENRDMYNILQQTYREYHLKQKNWHNISDSLLNVLYQYLLAWSSEEENNPQVEKFENILVSNISKKHFSIEKAMKQIPLSEDHLRKLFKRKTGRSPLEYLTEKRISYAKGLIEANKNGSIKISGIADMTGYDDPFHFSRVFRKATGYSPTQWARSRRCPNHDQDYFHPVYLEEEK